ncbi:MAG: hypothetical protein JXR42_01375 [Gammaproteobacteria bacterium]|nr:hypothetical protein [Gammaproteobacteria bacterium]
MLENKRLCETCYWVDIRDRVYNLDPALATLIDEISPDKSYYLYRVRYPFGAMIFKEGVLQLPDNGGCFRSFNHAAIDSSIKDELSYRVIPMGFVLKNSAEVFSEESQRVVPLTVLTEGMMFGVWEAFDPLFSYLIKLSWNVSAGARSLFMLPKITEATGHKRIKRRFGINFSPPATLKDHWCIFNKIVHADKEASSWENEIVLFPSRWFERLTSDPAWSRLQNYLYQVVWRQSMYWRFSTTLNLVWQHFAVIVSGKNLSCGIYQLETLKHLIAMGVGALPCFTAKDDGGKCGPITFLKKVFVETYNLNYAPTIMMPQHFSQEKAGNFGYYSINEPSLIETIPKNRQVSNVMQITREMKELFDEFREATLSDKLKVENTPIFHLMKHVVFRFTHPMYDDIASLTQSHTLTRGDRDLTFVDGYSDQLDFCYSSNFLKGCIRMEC